LATFYVISGVASKITDFEESSFDYVIVDEASQGLLAIFGAAQILGKKNIWIGDTKQLAPVVALSEDTIERKNYGVLVDGLKSLVDGLAYPVYQLTETHRLTERASRYTGIFYKDTLISKANKEVRLSYTEIGSEYFPLFNPNGGPTLIKTDLESGSLRPDKALEVVIKIVENLLVCHEALDISVLSHFIDTTKAIQKRLIQSLGYNRKLIVETVARIQGLTTDVTIFVIPNSSYHRSLESRLFNVATSRSKRHTLIIADRNILSRSQIESGVRTYLENVDSEYSFEVDSDGKFQGALNEQDESNKVGGTKSSTRSIDDLEQKKHENQLVGPKVVGRIDVTRLEKQKREIKKDKQNIYIIDTNIFVEFPEIISKIDMKYEVVLSAKVIDELDKLKVSISEDKKANIQKALRHININLDKSHVKMDTADLNLLPSDFNRKSPDNFILSVALKYSSENPILLTSDNGLQSKAKGLGLTTISLKDFLRQLR
jgi:DNA replication ATP-dependent helicase Dna2